MGTCVAKLFALLCVFLLYRTSPLIQAEKHSLYYIYTALSKPVDLPGIYQFTAMGLLDDRQIDYYNSEDQKKIPKQTWMKEKLQEDYWEEDTQSRKSKEQWLNENIDSLMKCMRHNESDLHVLQWRHGCEIEQQGDETKHINEYCYDGEDYVSFDYKESHWVAPVDTDLISKWKWNNVPILKQHTTSYLKMDCVDWLKKFREYADEEIRKASPPDVCAFARKSRDESKLELTCMVTGFYAKDMMMTMRKYRTPLPEDKIKSTGIQPNHDGTFQMQSSVEISEDEKAEYDCFVSHRTLTDPIITKWDGKCLDCSRDTVRVKIAAGIGGFLLVLGALVVYITKKNWNNDQETDSETPNSSATSSMEPILQKNEASSGDKPKDEPFEIKLSKRLVKQPQL